MGGFTTEQVDKLVIIERVSASISVLFTSAMFTSFLTVKEFRTLSNTLIFYASFANIFANVAALIGGSAMSRVNSPLCQFQGFLLELFMQSDPFWSCAMAVNVWLVFFRRYDATRLKKLYWTYALVCYGVPLIPALFCLFYKTKSKGRMYGNATLWCWIDTEWAPVRIYSYYAPIWLAIVISLSIYVRVGIEIGQKRSELRKAGNATYGTCDSFSDDNKTPFTGTRTTEVRVTTDSWVGPSINSPNPAYIREKQVQASTPKQRGLYEITISSTNPLARRSAVFLKRPSKVDEVMWAYFRVAVLFALSILITWIPASTNRVYGLVHPNDPSFVLNVGSALVLPLQGFWNTIIYFATSLPICRMVWKRWRQKRSMGTDINIVHLGGRRDGWEAKGRTPPVGMGKSESIIGLHEQRERAVSNDSSPGPSRVRTPLSDGASF